MTMSACTPAPLSCSAAAHAATHNAPGMPPANPSALPAATVHSQDLLQGHKSVTISHNGTLYRLQATRMGKLILTK
ncbi:hemin uptake protein HemP [Simplicispira metamorpha]|jgi:hemin uptake protein HemP|uniref:Hemin uptake protein HemP n=1 Tax=Simplicispira metamorpha TaxID=80881 RepID=A0A4R2N731_9BURK|nr:hemin uptake protein HemP [Simplicispira metamorpha]